MSQYSSKKLAQWLGVLHKLCLADFETTELWTTPYLIIHSTYISIKLNLHFKTLFMRLVFFPCFPEIVLRRRDMRRDSFRFRCEILHPHRNKLYVFPCFLQKWKWKSYPVYLPYLNFLIFSVCLEDYGLAFQVKNFVQPFVLPLPWIF